MKPRASLLIGLAAAQLLLADFDPAKWQFRRRIEVSGSQPMVSLKADAVLFGGSEARLADVRILRDTIETPYLIEILRGTSEEREVEANIFNKSVAPGPALQLTLDHKRTAHHNRIRLGTSARNFKQRVRIETSGDGVHWAVVREDGSIFDNSEADRPAASLTVDYPVSTERFLRVTVFGWSDLKMVNGVFLTFHDERDAMREQVAVFNKPTQTEKPDQKSSELAVDLGTVGLPHDVLRFEIGAGLFSRSVEIESGSRFLGQGNIWRTAQGESLTVEIPEDWDRYLKVRIANRDDHPLTVEKIAVEAIVRQIRFPTQQAGVYWIYYGNAGAHSPSYDLAEVAPRSPSEFKAAIGAQEANPDYHAPVPPTKPFSERYPGLLYGILSVAILVMGYFALRLFSKVS